MAFREFLDGSNDVGWQLAAYLRTKAGRCFAEEKKNKEAISSVEQFEERRAYIKDYFINAVGGLEIERTPLNAVCTGILDKGAYYIKKIIFQSQPGFYVTANLYMPAKLSGKAPGILFASGHNETAKTTPSYQKVCMDLVNNGFVVLSADPLGQGERAQYYDRESNRLMLTWSVNEHLYAGLQCDLTGSNIARYMIWDLIRALDYLCSLPEVDEKRIGMTGCSGGGTQTAYMMMVDERLKAAVPCVFITSREAYMRTGQAHDNEQNIYGAISEGLNYDDFLSCFAPKPFMVGAVDSDFFPVEGTVQSVERARRVYELFGCKDKAALHVAAGGHSFNDELRQSAVNWFLDALTGKKGDFITDTKMSFEEERVLWCTGCGQAAGEFDDARSVFDLNVEYLKKHKYEYSTDKSILKDNIKKILNLNECGNKIYPKITSTEISGKLRRRKLFFHSEEEIIVSGMYFDMPAGKCDACTILLLDNGTEDFEKETDLIHKLMQKGDVLVFDPRGTGGVKNYPVNSFPYYAGYGTEFKLNFDAVMLKMSLLGLRVFDVMRACDLLRQLNPDMKIMLAGRGNAALYAFFAAILRDDVGEAYLENMLQSFEKLVLTEYYQYDVRLDVYGILRYFDIPELAEAFKDKKIICRELPDVKGMPVF